MVLHNEATWMAANALDHLILPIGYEIIKILNYNHKLENISMV